MARLVRVQSVTPRERFVVDVHFTDGSQREIDLEPYLQGPIFETIRNDPFLFRSMRVERGAIAWPNDADIDPDVLYFGLTPVWAETCESEKQFLIRKEKQVSSFLILFSSGKEQYEKSSIVVHRNTDIQLVVL